MEFTTIHLPQFSVIGIAVRTTNRNGQAQKDIGELWQKFFENNTINQIPNKLSDDIFCVYTDYENDANGAYTTILGCKAATLSNVPEGLVGSTIPASTYCLYKSTGKLPECAVATWMHIWQTPINRRYSGDFNVYGPKAQNLNNAEVETYLSVS